jgi:hypothetical protein
MPSAWRRVVAAVGIASGIAACGDRTTEGGWRKGDVLRIRTTALERRLVGCYELIEWREFLTQLESCGRDELEHAGPRQRIADQSTRVRARARPSRQPTAHFARLVVVEPPDEADRAA